MKERDNEQVQRKIGMKRWDNLKVDKTLEGHDLEPEMAGKAFRLGQDERFYEKVSCASLVREEESRCWKMEPLFPAVLKQSIGYHRHNNISGFSSEWNYFCICKAKFDQIPTGREAGTQTLFFFFLINKAILSLWEANNYNRLTTVLTENRFLRQKEKRDYTTPSIPEAEQNYQRTATANPSGTKAPPPTQVEFFFCFSHWLGEWTSHESSKFPKWTHGAAEINENFNIGVSGGLSAGIQFWKGGVRIFTDFAGMLVTHYLVFI